MSKSKEARGWLLVLSLMAWCCVAADYRSQKPDYRTRNFEVYAPTYEIAKQVGDTAEVFRRDLAVEWLGKPLPPWSSRCPIAVKVGQIGAGGQTSFQFEPDSRGEVHVFNWNMSIQGSLERILDSVLPHEITHTILACHFRSPLPRWADEGAATLAEHESEKRRQVLTVQQVLNTQHRIPLRKLVDIRDYPKDMRDVLTLYAEGYSVAELLVQKGGKARYLKFLGDALKQGWDPAFKRYYGYKSVEQFEQSWQSWVVAGSPDQTNNGTVVASAETPAPVRKVRDRKMILRGQSPEDPFGGPTASTGAGEQSTRGGSDFEAPAPKRNGASRIRRLHTKVSNPAPSKSRAPIGMASLGEEEDAADDSAASSSSARSPRNAKEESPADELPSVANPEWSAVEEPAARSAEIPTEPAPAPKARRAQPRPAEFDESELVAAAASESVEEAQSSSSKDRYVAASSRGSAAKGMFIQPSRKRAAPQWSEFPQIARPSPFTDASAANR